MSLPDRIPIFPLPNAVLFPQTDLPLHVFEPRYRQMAADALGSDGILGLVLLRPGWEANYLGSPDTYAVGCAGRMEDVIPLPDGRYVFRLHGIQKVEIARYVRLEPYRVAEIRPLEELQPDEDEVLRDRERLLAAFTSLVATITGRASAPFALDPELHYTRLVNLVCAQLGLEPELRQRLLELRDVAERGRRIITLLEAQLEEALRARGAGDDAGSVH